MKFDPTLVVNSPHHQGSVLGRIVTGDSRLGQLLRTLVALTRITASVQAELAALRTQQQHVRDYLAELHHVSEFVEPPAPISRTDEPEFASRSYFEFRRGDVVIFDGVLRIAIKSVNRIPACADFLITLDGGDVVSSNLVTRLFIPDLEESDKKVEKRPTISAEDKICKILKGLFEKKPSKKSLKGLRTETFDCLYGEKATPAPWMQTPDADALPRTVMTPLDNHLDLHVFREKERRQWKKEPRVLTNFTGGKYGVYVQENGKPREEEILNAHEELATVPRKLLETWKDGPINKNVVEDRWIARIDHRTMVIEVRLKEGQSPKTIAHELGVSLARVEEAKRALPKCGKPCEDAPIVRKGRKPKRHYVRHGAAFIRQQDVNLAIGER